MAPEEEQALIEGIRRELAEVGHELKDSLTGRLSASSESMKKHIAAMQQDAVLRSKLADMKLPVDQEQFLRSVLALPPEALDILREHLGISKQA